MQKNLALINRLELKNNFLNPKLQTPIKKIRRAERDSQSQVAKFKLRLWLIFIKHFFSKLDTLFTIARQLSI